MVIVASMGSLPTERPRENKRGPNCGPMMQQGAMGAHGHEMHPQKFIRLIGCCDSARREQDDLLRHLHFLE